MTSAKVLNLNINSSTINSSNKSISNEKDSADKNTDKAKSKKSSITTNNIHLSSTSSMNNNNNKSPLFDDDDDRFYDAADYADSKDFESIIKKMSKDTNKFVFDDNDTIFLDGDHVEIDDNDDEDDFYDTKTSRHPSEMGDSNLNKHRMISSNEDKYSYKLNSPKVTVNGCSNNNINFSVITNPSKLNSNVDNHNQNNEKSSNNKNISDVSNVNEDQRDDQIKRENEKETDEDDEQDAELETAWTFWIDKCFKGTSKHEYEAGLKLIYSVKTVQTFWSVFNNIPDVTALPNRYSYHLMRNNRKPLWEDAENSQGGQWKLKCNKNDTSLVWREVVLAGIGEQFSDCVSPFDDIVGLTVGKREKEDIIQIWNMDHKYEKEATVCEKLKQLVPDVKFSVIFYKAHNTHEAYEGEQSSFSSINNSNNKYQSNNKLNNKNYQKYKKDSK